MEDWRKKGAGLLLVAVLAAAAAAAALGFMYMIRFRSGTAADVERRIQADLYHRSIHEGMIELALRKGLDSIFFPEDEEEGLGTYEAESGWEKLENGDQVKVSILLDRTCEDGREVMELVTVYRGSKENTLAARLCRNPGGSWEVEKIYEK